MNRGGCARALSGIAVAWLTATTAAPALAGQRIVNGLETQDFPTTGGLLYSGGGVISSNNASLYCSGTLIGCKTFLTAAHCVADDSAATHYWVYLEHGGIYTVSSVTYNPAYGSGAQSGNDVAIVKLSASVTGIDPTTFNSTHDLEGSSGDDGVIVGFGQTSGSGNDYGIKRYGDVVTSNCAGVTTGEGTEALVCWDYANPLGPAGTDSNTCNGDSGGPLFMTFSGSTEVVGVTSAGSSSTCSPTDHSWDASVYNNRTWIAGQLGADPTATCGGLPPVGDPSVLVQDNNASLGAGNPDDSFSVTLTGTPTLARFTLNGTDNGTFNPDFFVKQGAGASASSFDCKADGTSVFGACEFTNPAPGTWSVFVDRTAGSGKYQITTTVFGGDPPVCGNDTAEFGEDCDGSDLGSCPIGPCSACACPAPACGNDVTEDGEECDGTDDGACPGACQGDCSCPNTCSSGYLYGLTFVSDAKRFSYKALLYDPAASYADLNPTSDEFVLDVSDLDSSVALAIPAGDSRWFKVDPARRRYAWRDIGTLDGLRRVRLLYKGTASTPYWKLLVKGKAVPGADTIDTVAVLNFRLDFDGTCHLESW